MTTNNLMAVFLTFTFLTFYLAGVYSYAKESSRVSNQAAANMDVSENSSFCPIDTQTPLPEQEPRYFTRDFINERLTGEGLIGWIHGSTPRFSSYTFTYRSEDPNDPLAFFKAEQFTLIPNEELIDQFKNLKRHDKVVLTGTLNETTKPVDHIYVDSLDVFPHEPETPRKTTEAALPEILDTQALVHANVFSKESGRALILEVGQTVAPVVVMQNFEEIASKLLRGDLIRIRAQGSFNRRVITHYILGDDSSDSLVILNSINNCHGLSMDLKGHLVRFEKSPAISRTIYAVKVDIAPSNGLNFTFLPKDFDPDKFSRIQVVLENIWQDNIEAVSTARNYSEIKRVKVNVSGTINVTSRNQANPQIFIENAEAIGVSIVDDL